MPILSAFPIITREWRARFRRDHAYVLLSVLVIAATWAMIDQLNGSAPSQQLVGTVQSLAPLSQDLLVLLAWTQIIGICMLGPMNSAPLIARERESGSSEHLLLAPMAPLRLVLEKWAAGGLFLLLVLLALWPLDLVALLMGNSSIAGLWGAAAIALGCLAWGCALGTACSAHSRRAALALRSATGLAGLWLLFSLVCGALAGEAPVFGRGGGLPSMPTYLVWFGRTNPVLCVLDLLQPSTFVLAPKWPFCAAFLALGTPLFLFVAVLGVRKPLPELQMIAPKKGQRGGVSGVLSRLEMPFVGRFAPANPVLGREARGKFRLRQPPLAVLITEIVLALGVAWVYLYLAWLAWTDSDARPTIFWGVVWVGFVVSALSASALGGGALARERENGTWEALQLSLLSPAEVVRGKLIASLATPVVLSLPAWPLLFLCLNWTGSWTAVSTYRDVQPFQLVAAIVVWLGTLWLQTLIGLFVSLRAKRVGGAIGGATAIAFVWTLGPVLLLIFGAGPSSNSLVGLLAILDPLVALALALDAPHDYMWAATGWPFGVFALCAGAMMLSLIESEMALLLRGERSLDRLD